MRVAGSRKTYLGDFGNSLSSKTSWRGSGVGRKSRNGTLGVAGSGVYEARWGARKDVCGRISRALEGEGCMGYVDA